MENLEDERERLKAAVDKLYGMIELIRDIQVDIEKALILSDYKEKRGGDV